MKKFLSLLFFSILAFAGCQPQDTFPIIELPNRISDLVLDQDGIVWAAGNGGVVRYDPDSGRYEHFTVEQGLPGNDIRQLEVDTNGLVWAIGNESAAYFTGKRWQVFRPETLEFKPFQMEVAPNGDLWFINNIDYLWKYDGETLTRFETLGTPPIAIGQDGVVWVSGYDLHSYNGNKWQTHAFPSQITDHFHFIFDMVVDSEGKVWFTVGGTGRSREFYIYDGTGWMMYDPHKYLEGVRSKSAIWPDPEEGIWYVTDTYNLQTQRTGLLLVHLIDGKFFLEPIPIEGLHAEAITAFVIEGEDGIWLSSDGYSKSWGSSITGIFHRSDDKWQYFTEFSPRVSSTPKSP